MSRTKKMIPTWMSLTWLKPSKDLFFEIIYSVIKEDDFSEALRLKIIEATA